MFHRGAGSVGYWRDWPGEWHCPVILKLTTETGGRMPPINLVLGLAAFRPTEVGGTVGGLSPRRRLVSLPLPPLLDMHCCQWVSWQQCIISSLFHSLIFLHLTPSFTSSALLDRTQTKNIYLEGLFLAGKRNLTVTEGLILAGKRIVQGTS